MLQYLMAQGTALVAEKERIAANGEYSLSGERYRESAVLTSGKWPLVALRDVCSEILSGGTPSTKNDAYWQGDIPWITSADIVDIQTAIPRKFITEAAVRESATNIIPSGNVIVVTRVGLGKLFRNDFDVCISQDSQGLILKEGVSADFLVYVLKERVASFKNTSQGSTIQGVTKRQLAELQIPLPPLEVQREIVAEIEGYQRVIDGARAVIENYRAQIAVDPEWPLITFAEAPFQIIDGDRGVNYPTKEDFSSEGYCVFLNTKNVRSDGFNFDEMEFITREKDEALRKGRLSRGDVVLTTRGTIGNVGYYDKFTPFDVVRINSGMLIFRPDENRLSGNYLFRFFQSQNFKEQRDAIVSGAAQPQLPIRSLNEARLPLPDLETQHAIVAEVETEQALVNANRELIERFEKKIHVVIGQVWGGDESSY